MEMWRNTMWDDWAVKVAVNDIVFKIYAHQSYLSNKTIRTYVKLSVI